MAHESAGSSRRRVLEKSAGSGADLGTGHNPIPVTGMDISDRAEVECTPAKWPAARRMRLSIPLKRSDKTWQKPLKFVPVGDRMNSAPSEMTISQTSNY